MERQARRRRRPAFSCIACRRRKIKCDRTNPCARCVAAKSQCTYEVCHKEPVARQQPQQDNSWGPTSSPLASVPSPLVQAQQASTTNRSILERENHSSVPEVATAAATVRAGYNASPSALGRSDTRPLNLTQDTELNLGDILQYLRKLEESSESGPIYRLSETGQDILGRRSGLQDSQIILNKTRVLRWSHLMGAAQEFAPIVNCYIESVGHGKGASAYDAETVALHVQIGDLLQKCKDIARRIKGGRPSRSLSYPDFDLSPPSRDVADSMVSVYFSSFESMHRILHEPTFQTEYQRYWNHQASVTTDLRLKMLLVIGIGSSLSQHGDLDAGFRNMVHQWVYASQMWLSGSLEKDRLNIAGIQIHCLTILARQIFSIGGDLVWISVGSLIHKAMQIGLHRDPKHLPAVSVLQAECRRRLWATILEMLVQSSLDASMPPRISFDEFDTEAPSNNNDDEIDESTASLQPQPKGNYTTTSMQLILLDSLPVRLRILQLLNGLHSEISYLDVLALSSEITDAYRACISFMKENEESGVTPFHRNLLDYLLRRFLIPLHCPFASKARKNPLFAYSLKASLDAAMAIVSPEPDEGFSRLVTLGGGMFRETIRWASTIITLELIAQAETQRLDGTLYRNSRYIDLLKQAVKDMTSLSLERIHQGETNVKLHMYLFMTTAQIEAMETGAPCDLKIAQGARDSLELCHNILQTRLGTMSSPYLNEMDPTSTTLDGGQDGYGLDLDLEFFFPDAGFS